MKISAKYSSNNKMVTQEQTEWDAVNRMLQHRGFKPIRFADPTENKNLADLVLLEKTSLAELHVALRTMFADSERRQALIQELIRSNASLKQEVEQHQVRATSESQRAEELEVVLSSVKVKVQGLEDSIISKAAYRQDQLQRLQQDKRDAEKRCQALHKELGVQKELVSQLQKYLQQAAKEEQNRAVQQHEAFRPSQQHSSGDHIAQKCSCCKKNDCLDFTQNRDTSALTMSSYKALLKSYQEQLKKIKRQREELKTELRCLKLDLESRSIHESENKVTLRSEAEIQRIADDPKKLQDHQHSVSRLAQRFLPWRWEDRIFSRPNGVNIEDVTHLVETLLDETTPDRDVLQSPTKATLLSMVSHFQKLFDVSNLRGVYPRMNEVYTRMAEMNNVLRNLRDVLDMDEAASPGDVVNTVASVVTGQFSQNNLKVLLQSTDIDSIIVKLKEHEEFFPAFHTLVLELLSALGIQRLEDILPTVSALKSHDCSGT